MEPVAATGSIRRVTRKQWEGLTQTRAGMHESELDIALPSGRLAAGKTKDDSRLQRSWGFWADEPRALPWAGMNVALGLYAAPSGPHVLRNIFAPEESRRVC